MKWCSMSKPIAPGMVSGKPISIKREESRLSLA
jgi:hypothetical protein